MLTDFWPLLVIAFVGTMNPTSGDASIFVPLEQTVITQTIAARCTNTRIIGTCLIVTSTSMCEGRTERRPMTGRLQMSQAVHQRNLEQPVFLAALFVAFLIVSLCGFGGGLVWARRIAVEKRRWISEQEFADIVSLCQFMPGPNIVGIAVCIGA
jgi:hypothetical protein